MINSGTEAITLIHEMSEASLRGYKNVSEEDLKYLINYIILDIEKRMGKITFFKQDHTGMKIGMTKQDLFDLLESTNSFHFATGSDQQLALNNYIYDFSNNILKMSCVNQITNTKVYSSEISFDILKLDKKECCE